MTRLRGYVITKSQKTRTRHKHSKQVIEDIDEDVDGREDLGIGIANKLRKIQIKQTRYK